MHYNIRPAQMGSRLKKLPLSAMAALCVVILWGCLFIYTARAGGVSPLYFTMRQMAWLVCGSMAFLLAVVLFCQPYGVLCSWLFIVFIHQIKTKNPATSEMHTFRLFYASTQCPCGQYP